MKWRLINISPYLSLLILSGLLFCSERYWRHQALQARTQVVEMQVTASNCLSTATRWEVAGSNAIETSRFAVKTMDSYSNQLVSLQTEYVHLAMRMFEYRFRQIADAAGATNLELVITVDGTNAPGEKTNSPATRRLGLRKDGA